MARINTLLIKVNSKKDITINKKLKSSKIAPKSKNKTMLIGRFKSNRRRIFN